MSEISQRIDAAVSEVGRVLLGKEKQIRLALCCLLARGHLLIEDLPGMGKTTLSHALAQVLGLSWKRVQFTSDLLPADILGVAVYQREQGQFSFHAGPIFTQLLLADEINRASPRTQSALLQAMQEKMVTVAGENRPLAKPFHVLATQNPIEQEGTYPLPEAQLDRFLLQIDVDYPSREEERAILLATTGTDDIMAEPVLDADGLIGMQRLVRAMPVGEQVVNAILTLVRAARPGEAEAHPAATQRLAFGPGPRAAQSLMLAVRARALLRGRLAPGIEDVEALAGPALTHRMALTFAARAEGASIRSVIDDILGGLTLEAAA
jgi:MoxR-like ATPase